MDPRINNPFLISGYESPEYFCDREKETEKLMETLRNGRNITLTSPRRLGKTGLIKHVFHLLSRQDPKTAAIYIDLYPTESLYDFTQAFSSAVLGQLDSSPVKVLKKIASLFKGLRPSLTVDQVTGQPKVGLDIAAGTEAGTLDQVFSYLKQTGKTCYIAFDEFQQITRYPEQNVEALLRSYIQDLHNVHFIFSGSQAHMLGEMFLSPKRPFYQSTSEITIGTIDEEAYFDFAAAFYGGDLDETLVQESIRDILRENEFYYQHLLQVYPKGQVKLVKAIAKEKKVKEITAGAFISKYGLTATSSVKSALSRMLDEEIIYRSPNGYLVYDRFFGQWLDATF